MTLRSYTEDPQHRSAAATESRDDISTASPPTGVAAPVAAVLAPDVSTPAGDWPSQEHLHVAWINEHAASVGGCEQYVQQTATLLRRRGVRSTLLYDVDGQLDPGFVSSFEGAFPIVELQRQLQALRPDVVFVHRLRGARRVRELASAGVAVARFFHDHRLFCLREHKYTTIGSQTCQRPAGLHCYACLGFLRRTDSWPGVGVRTLGSMQAELRANMHLDAFVVGSDYMAQHVALHGFDPRQIHTVPLYVDCQDDPVASPETGLIVFSGQLVRGKGVDVLLDALPQVSSPARLVIAGDGRQRDELQRQCHDAGLRQRVTFAGRLDQHRLRQLLRSASVAVMPSRTPETFGLAGLEALAQGTPVVATRVGGVSQWMVHEQTGLLTPPNDSRLLAAAINRILSDPQWARQLGAAGQRRCREQFAPQLHAERLLAVFRTLVKTKRS